MKAATEYASPPRLFATAAAEHVSRVALLGATLDTLVPDRRRQAAMLLNIARVAAGLSQADLARDLGVSRGTIARWETCRTRIPARALPAIAATLAVHPTLLETP